MKNLKYGHQVMLSYSALFLYLMSQHLIGFFHTQENFDKSSSYQLLIFGFIPTFIPHSSYRFYDDFLCAIVDSFW